MRFDYYAATIEDRPTRVVDALRKLGHGVERCERLAKAYHYHDGVSVVHEHLGVVCRVFQSEGHKAYAFASSDATDAFVDVVRSEWPDRHLVTRLDPCQDFYDGRARRTLGRIMRGMAKRRRMRLQLIHDPLDRTAGQTTYLGSPSSDARMRMYDKGWEQYHKLQAQCGRKGLLCAPELIRFPIPGTDVTVQADQWVRAELQARPKGEDARRAAAVCTPEQAWGLTDWSQELARQAFALDLERLAVQGRKLSTNERALQFMVQQYGRHLQQLRFDVGTWECVGLTLGEMIDEQQQQRRR